MRCILPLALASLAAIGCGGGDCSQSADIQVTLAPNSDVPVSSVVRLHVMLSVADGPVGAKDILVGPDLPLEAVGSTFLLHPDPVPASDPYDVSLTVQAFDAPGDLVAIGSDSLQAMAKGCNRMTVFLTALPLQSGGDMALPPGTDLTGFVPSTDMAGCVGGTPDEDNDGRANFCDICPADPDPIPADTDADGLSDACDPDPMTATNTLVYFDPFDTASGHWSGTHQVTQSYMNLDTNGVGTDSASNATDMLPLNVRVQADIYPNSEHGNGGGDTGVFVGTSANPNQGNGVFCGLTWNNGGSDTLNIYHVNNGSYGVPSSQSLGAELVMAHYRMRLTHRAGTWTCEALLTGGSPVTVTTNQTVTAPLFITVLNDNMGSHFHHVVVESKL